MSSAIPVRDLVLLLALVAAAALYAAALALGASVLARRREAATRGASGAVPALEPALEPAGPPPVSHALPAALSAEPPAGAVALEPAAIVTGRVGREHVAALHALVGRRIAGVAFSAGDAPDARRSAFRIELDDGTAYQLFTWVEPISLPPGLEPSDSAREAAELAASADALVRVP